MKERIAEIIPIRRLIRNLTVFDYKIPAFLNDQIKLGQLVQISFQKTEFLGVVTKIKNNTNVPVVKLKAITNILRKEPIMTKQQFKLLDWMSGYYFVAKSTILKSMIPDFPKKPASSSLIYELIQKSTLTISSNFVPWLKNEVKKFLNHHHYYYSLTNPDQSILYAFYLIIVKKIFKENKIILILLPDIQELKKLYSKINSIVPSDKIAIIFSGLTIKEYFYQWEKVLKNKVNVILGTRMASLLPFSELNTIIVHLEENENHKSADQNPRFHNRDVAWQLAKYYKIKLLFTSQTPSLELLNLQKSNLVNNLNSPPVTKDKISLISMENEYKKKNYTGLSEPLQKLINETLKNKKSIFLFLNRKGEASAYICQDCHLMARCSECLLPLTIHHKNNFVCHHCKRKTPLFLNCPNCHGHNLKTIGRGIEKLENELKTIFPNIPILRIDKDLPIKDKLNGIIIGTKYALNNIIPPKNLGAIGILSCDNLLYQNDFRSEEMTYQLLTKVIYFGEKPVPVMIQTFSPENKTMKAVVNQNFLSFTEKELILRKKLHWPPYLHLIKLIYQHKELKEAKQKMEKVIDNLKRHLKTNDQIEINGPLEARVPRVRGKFRYVSIIKTNNVESVEIKKLIKLVPEDFIIDVDPITLL